MKNYITNNTTGKISARIINYQFDGETTGARYIALPMHEESGTVDQDHLVAGFTVDGTAVGMIETPSGWSVAIDGRPINYTETINSALLDLA
jgi:hypothetical protein